MNLTVTTENDIEQILACELRLVCAVHDDSVRAQCLESLRSIYTWWLRDAFMSEPSIKGLLHMTKKNDLQNLSVAFAVSTDRMPEPRNLFLIHHQHELKPGISKSGAHYQLQIPHPDIGSKTRPPSVQALLVPLANTCERSLSSLYIRDRASISLDYPLSPAKWEKIKSAALTMAVSFCKQFPV